MTLSSTQVVFTEQHPIWDGISLTSGEHGEPIIDVNVGGINVPMNADSGSEEGSLSNMTAAKLNINRFPKINTEKMTKGRITKTISNVSMPLKIGDITFVAPMSAKSDLLYDVFPLEYLLEKGYKIEMNDTALKVIHPAARHT
ncbi:MAG: hypothetical protein WCC17_05105 [Candidatus Nitrosopolaris sp.]